MNNSRTKKHFSFYKFFSSLALNLSASLCLVLLTAFAIAAQTQPSTPQRPTQPQQPPPTQPSEVQQQTAPPQTPNQSQQPTSPNQTNQPNQSQTQTQTTTTQTQSQTPQTSPNQTTQTQTTQTTTTTQPGQINSNPANPTPATPSQNVGSSGGIAPAVLPDDPPPVAPNFQAPARPLPSAERVGVDVADQLPLSLQEAITLALENNNDIDSSRIGVKIAEFDLRAARGVYDPVFNSQNYYERRTTPTASTIGGASNGVVTQTSFVNGFGVTGYSPRAAVHIKVIFPLRARRRAIKMQRLIRNFLRC